MSCYHKEYYEKHKDAILEQRKQRRLNVPNNMNVIQDKKKTDVQDKKFHISHEPTILCFD
jgi:hypothetical protein